LSGMPSWPTVSVTSAATSASARSARDTSTGRERTTTASHGRSAPSRRTFPWSIGTAPVVGAGTWPPAGSPGPAVRASARSASSSAPSQPDPPPPHGGDEEGRAHESRDRAHHELTGARHDATQHVGADHEHGPEQGAVGQEPAVVGA